MNHRFGTFAFLVIFVLVATTVVSCEDGSQSSAQRSVDVPDNNRLDSGDTSGIVMEIPNQEEDPAIVKMKLMKPRPPLPGLLYPRESESREVRSLDGMWNFAVAPVEDPGKGHRELWVRNGLSKLEKVRQMPVPSSYNDVTTSRELRDHVGVVWYERTFYVPVAWAEERVFVHFGSVNYLAEVWINGQFVGNHEIGHLPFEIEIGTRLLYARRNRITVAVDNSLTQTSIPQGILERKTGDNDTVVLLQTYTFDFFNYAGIHRPVLLHTKPRVYVEDITVKTSSSVDGTGIVEYSVRAAGAQPNESVVCSVSLRKRDGTPAVKGTYGTFNGTIRVPEATLWWPRGMHKETAYLYTLLVLVSVATKNATTKTDVYRLPVGIRSLRWTMSEVLINEKPIYLRGFGRHEDSPIRGRGLDLVTMTRDYELLEWVGANAFRTSHYPYSDEVLDMADKRGILIIDECPAVNLQDYSPELLSRHEMAMSELIRRDKNRPSVIMWSIANEPQSQLKGTEAHFGSVSSHTRTLDPTRPITAALNRNFSEDRAGQYLDVIGFNRYNSWYSDTGRLDMIVDNVVREATAFHEKYNKPVIMFEYGADCVAGLHELPSFVWSEEYQADVFSKHFVAFDRLRRKNFFIGEFIWNFADFRTAETIIRVGGNKKGIFTRTREPKMVARYVRERYQTLANSIDGADLPNDLRVYVTEGVDSGRDEL